VKLATVMTLVAAGSAPVLAGAGIDWLHMDDVKAVLDGGNITQIAANIAKREFTPDVRLTLVTQADSSTIEGEFGDTIHANDGEAYRHVTLEVLNAGRLDVAVHTFHFTARDDMRHTHKAELGIKQKFEVTQLPQGNTTVGVVIFQVPKGTQLASITWQGELANSTLVLMDPASPRPSSPSGTMEPAPNRPTEASPASPDP